MQVARLKIGIAEYNTKGKQRESKNRCVFTCMALEMAHTDGKVIRTWIFMCHGFLCYSVASFVTVGAK